MKNILIPTDFSKEANYALDFASNRLVIIERSVLDEREAPIDTRIPNHWKAFEESLRRERRVDSVDVYETQNRVDMHNTLVRLRPDDDEHFIYCERQPVNRDKLLIDIKVN